MGKKTNIVQKRNGYLENLISINLQFVEKINKYYFVYYDEFNKMLYLSYFDETKKQLYYIKSIQLYDKIYSISSSSIDNKIFVILLMKA